jgi:hypothetical protein
MEHSSSLCRSVRPAGSSRSYFDDPREQLSRNKRTCPEIRMTSCLAFLQGCRRGAIPLRVKRPVVVMIFRLSDHAHSTIARLDLNPRRPVAAVD